MTCTTLAAKTRQQPPDWAVRQRQLIAVMDRAAHPFVAHSTRPDGTLIQRTVWTSMDGTDNGYEAFLSFPLFYLLGGDVPLNLSATSLVTNAYLYTGEDKYRQWVLDYLQAWEARCAANDGIMPDNIGPNGIIGELMGGKWWGGYYGWRWPHGAHNIVEPALVGGKYLRVHLGPGAQMRLHLGLQRFAFQPSYALPPFTCLQ